MDSGIRRIDFVWNDIITIYLLEEMLYPKLINNFYALKGNCMKYRLLHILDLIKGRRGHKPNIKNHKQPYSYKANRSIAANIRDLTNTIANEAEANRQEQENENKSRNNRENWTLFLVFLTTIFVFIQAISFSITIIDARKATKKQQELTVESNEITRKAYTAVQRAFLLVDELRVNPIKDENGSIQRWEYIPIIRNSGNTPATKVDYIILDPDMGHMARPDYTVRHRNYNMLSYQIQAPQDPDDVLNNPPDAVKYRIIRNGIVGPQREIEGIGNHWNFHILPKDIESNKLLSGQYGAFIFGSIRYADVFAQAHVTKFCFYLGGMYRKDGINSPPPPKRCLHWNCIDEQCDADEAAYDAKFKKASAKVNVE